MKLLKDILYKTGLESVQGATHLAITGITMDSRQVKKDMVFVAVKGSQSDGHLFIPQAIQAGAIAIVCQEYPQSLQPEVTYVQVKNPAEALGIMAAHFYGNPSEKLKVVGVTGTNGKTTVASLLYSMYRQMGEKVGLISTVKNLINNEAAAAKLTTPDAVTIQALMADMVKAGCKYCFMEVSSIGVDQRRIAGIQFTGAVFTNITHDHLDYHGTFDNYLLAKKQFFDGLPKDAFALTNADDRHGQTMVLHTKARIQTYALKQPADFHTKVLENLFSGLLLRLDGREVHTLLLGHFNAYNLTAVYATAVLLGMDRLQALTALSTLAPVEGRFQVIPGPNGITGLVDYAHTPDALKNVLETLQNIRVPGQNIITVVGCGGDRDAAKRPLMGGIAAALSDKAIFTADNPRSEDPRTILSAMEAGVDILHRKKTLTIEDRTQAIRTAVSLAQTGDVILVAGKGHETYQEIQGVKHPFDDRQVLKSAFDQTQA
jgi:UDP-N-acetylmuramoyl-L-alanyl-D-glutamate--2,6-diaminopimelate ligase